VSDGVCTGPQGDKERRKKTSNEKAKSETSEVVKVGTKKNKRR